ncbi:unnamed protein product [Ectocarpus sp. 12 AP-2014]
MQQNLRERILKQLRSEIISGESLPGTLYSVPALSAELDVSTTPVREALLELANSGLVEPVRNKGFRVSRPSMKELQDLFAMRDLLEIQAAKLMMIADPLCDTEPLKHYAHEIERAVKEDDVRAYLVADRSFHNAMFIASGNELLAKMALALRDRMRLFGIRSGIGVDRQRESVDEHYRIIELIDAGKTDELITLLRYHILSWEPIFSAALEQDDIRNRKKRMLGSGS